MSIARIIVPVTGATRDGAALAAAFAAAKPFNSHVAALLVQPDPRLSVPYMGAPLSPRVVQSIMDAAGEVNRQAAQSAHTAFDAAASKAQASIVERPVKTQAVTCSFHEAEGYLASTIAKAARLSDLVVFGPIASSDGADVNECFVDILTKTDKPVLISTNVPARIPGKVAVAWDGGAAACHAVTRAMPFLERAERVTILRVGSERKQDDSGAWYSNRTSMRELQDYLALNGVSADEQIFERGIKGTGEALLDAALALGADLLVMGGYGHSHLRETIFGGVTAHIRWHADLPVLMVH